MNILLVTGPVNGGKTTFVSRWIEEKRTAGWIVKGVISRASCRQGEKLSYRFVDIESGREAVYALRTRGGEERSFPRYSFLDEGFSFAGGVLRSGLAADALVVDEAGPLELGGGGLMDVLKELFLRYEGTLVVVVRETLLSRFLETFPCDPGRVSILHVPSRDTPG